MRVLVTGADGFIGSHLLPQFTGRYETVVGTAEATSTEARDGKYRPVDICTGEGLTDALAGVDAVVHLAARNHVLKETAADPLAEYRRVNVEGTRNVVRAAGQQGVGLFIHLSSVKAMGEGGEDILDEASPCTPATPYGISKLESEEVVRTEAGGAGISAVIVRLPMVYGPGNRGNLPRMIRWAERGYPFPLFQPDNLRSMVYVGNVVAGIMAVLDASPKGIATYILKDKEDYSTRGVYGSICDSLGKKPRYFPVPSFVARAAGWMSEDFRKITGSFRVSSEKFSNDFRFTPPFSLEEGIERTVDWYRRSAR